MTHTETTHESAQRLEQASRYLVSLARAMRSHRRRMQETDCRRDLPCTQQCCARRCGLSHDRQHGGIVIQPLYREAATQANRTVWPTTRAFFPNISVCLGERRGKDE